MKYNIFRLQCRRNTRCSRQRICP